MTNSKKKHAGRRTAGARAASARPVSSGARGTVSPGGSPARGLSSVEPSGSCETVRVERMTYGTEAVAHLANGKACFVAGAAPGDTVRVEVVEDKKNFARGRLLEVVEPSELREMKLSCDAACGGCPWAHLRYEAQLDAKRGNVVSALTRIGHFDAVRADELVAPCVPSKRQWGYRNKLELNAGTDAQGRLVLGMFREGTHDLDTPAVCPLAHKAAAGAPKALTGALRFLQGSSDLGIFRIGVRASVRTNDLEVALWTTPGAFPRAAAAKTLSSALKATSIVRVMAQPGKERAVKGVERLSGKGHWEEDLADCRFLVSAPSFFQVNTAQAEKLVALALEGVEAEAGTYVADLYAGGGTFSIPLAQAGADVVAVESAASSVRDLRRNAETNQIDIEVIGGDAARELPELGIIDGLVVDPPRAGLADGVVKSIAAAAPQRVAYVSCNPTTLARDLALFEQEGYRLQRVTPVDLFPQTYHVETVSVLTRENLKRQHKR